MATMWLIEETHPHGYKRVASRAYATRAEARWRLGEMAAEPTSSDQDFCITRRAIDLLAYDRAPCGCDDANKLHGIVYRVVKL